MTVEEIEVLFFVECAKRDLLLASALIEEECNDDKVIKGVDLETINSLVLNANGLMKKAIEHQNQLRRTQPPVLTLVVNNQGF